MAEGKKSFVMYADYIENFEMLSDEQAGKLIKHLLQYVNDLDPYEQDPLLKMAALPIKKQMKRDLKKWEQTKDQKSKSGRLGNLKRWNNDLYRAVKNGKMSLEDAENTANHRKISHSDKSVANVAVTDTVTDTVTVNVLSKESEKTRAIGFLKSNYPARFEQEFEMRYSKKIKDLPNFYKRFNNKVDTENLEYTDRILFGRLDNFADTWIQNQNKYNNQNPEKVRVEKRDYF